MSAYLFVLGLLFISTSYVVSSEKIVICYYGTWATYRWGLGKFDVDDINPSLCTHLVYAFVGIDNQGTVVTLEPYLDLPGGRDNFGKFNALKQTNPKLKTLLAVGGWNEGSGKYSTMAASATFRKNFITSALNMVQTYGFDGFDLDWEYPGRRDSVFGSADINNFSTLVKELKEEFQKHGFLVTAAVSAVADAAVLSYDIPEISKYLDLIGLMTYDFYGSWDGRTGHNAGLHRGEGDENVARTSLYTVDVAVEYWLDQGCPPEKLVVGLPFYGRTFILSDANVNGVRAPSSGAGIAGPFTATAGSIGYNEFCDLLQTQSWDVRYDSLAEVPYAVQGRNWVSYDDANSLTKKIEWSLQKNIGGIMLWSIETDDFNGVCGQDYPLLRAINKALGRDIDGSTTEGPETSTAATESVATETTTVKVTTDATTVKVTESTTESEVTVTDATTTSTTTTTAGSTEATTPSGGICHQEGITSNPATCAGFLMCVRDAKGSLYAVKFDCPADTFFDSHNLYCNYAHLVDCNV